MPWYSSYIKMFVYQCHDHAQHVLVKQFVCKHKVRGSFQVLKQKQRFFQNILCHHQKREDYWNKVFYFDDYNLAKSNSKSVKQKYETVNLWKSKQILCLIISALES